MILNISLCFTYFHSQNKCQKNCYISKCTIFALVYYVKIFVVYSLYKEYSNKKETMVLFKTYFISDDFNYIIL